MSSGEAQMRCRAGVDTHYEREYEELLHNSCRAATRLREEADVLMRSWSSGRSLSERRNEPMGSTAPCLNSQRTYKEGQRAAECRPEA